jgi:hypothetical protein
MVKLIFYGSDKSETDEEQLRCYCNINNEIYLSINEQFICLDKDTAIRLSKELRKQIALIQDEEGI